MNTVLFDLDGTLTNPREGIVNCLRHALDRLGRAHDPDADLSHYIGPPLQHTFAEILGTTEQAVIDLAIFHYRERFQATGMFENRVYEGIDSLLQRLNSAGCTLYVATSKPLVFATQILEHFQLRDYFAAVYGSELDGRLSDKRELIRHLIEQVNPVTDRCYMVGDRKHDAIGALTNNITPVGALWGFGSREELAAAGVTRLHASPAELDWLADR